MFEAGKGGLHHIGRHVEPERAAAAFGMFDTDLAAHGVDKPFGNRKPKPRTAETPRMAGIGLHEFAEDFLALVVGHAHTGVAHFEAQAVAFVDLDHFHIDANPAGVGEFDRVADEIGQHLPQPHSIGANGARHRSSDDG